MPTKSTSKGKRKVNGRKLPEEQSAKLRGLVVELMTQGELSDRRIVQLAEQFKVTAKAVEKHRTVVRKQWASDLTNTPKAEQIAEMIHKVQHYQRLAKKDKNYFALRQLTDVETKLRGLEKAIEIQISGGDKPVQVDHAHTHRVDLSNLTPEQIEAFARGKTEAAGGDLSQLPQPGRVTFDARPQQQLAAGNGKVAGNGKLATKAKSNGKATTAKKAATAKKAPKRKAAKKGRGT